MAYILSDSTREIGRGGKMRSFSQFDALDWLLVVMLLFTAAICAFALILLVYARRHGGKLPEWKGLLRRNKR